MRATSTGGTRRSRQDRLLVGELSDDVQPDWDYIFFDKFYTFRSDGKYKITAMKPDGTPIATGEVRIKYR